MRDAGQGLGRKIPSSIPQASRGPHDPAKCLVLWTKGLFDSSKKNYIWLGWLFVAADFSLAVVSRGYSLIAERGLQGM